MMKIVSFFLVSLSLLFLGGCGKKDETQEQTPPASVAPATKLPAPATPPESNVSVKPEIDPLSHHFVLTNADAKELNVTLESDRVIFSSIDKPLVMINLFATWCPPCRAELPYLEQLRKKHAKKLAVIGILVNDDQNSTQLRHFAKKNKIHFFISNAKDNSALTKQLVEGLGLSENFPIPLSLLYINGKLYRYYEGAMPIEMMENEIKQARKQL